MQQGRGAARGIFSIQDAFGVGGAPGVSARLSVGLCVYLRDNTEGSVFIRMPKGKRGFLGLTAGGPETGGFPLTSGPPGQQGRERVGLRPSCQEGWLKDGFSSSP